MLSHPVTFQIKGTDAPLIARQNSICEEILKRFQANFSTCNLRVICLIDDEDHSHLRQRHGAANRGLFSPVKGLGLGDAIPHYFWDTVVRRNYDSWTLDCLYDCLIYVHGSTCSSELGLTLTLAHELQHFVQYATARPTWAVDRLFRHLPPPSDGSFQRWADFPIEREARIIAKRIAVDIHGAQAVSDYINQRIDARVTDLDAKDWEFVLGVEPSDAYSATENTRSLVQKFKLQLLEVQAQDWSDCQDVQTLDFESDEWNGGSIP